MAEHHRRESINVSGNFVEVTSDPLSKISQKKSLHQSSQNLLSKLQDLEYSIVHADQVSQDESGLCELMSKGAWKSVYKLAQRCMIQSKFPHIKLQFRLCSIVALIKLRQFELANNEMKDIGYFDDLKNLCETYHKENLYLDKKGSFVPFNVRLLYAQIPCYLGKDNALEHLYVFLSFCETMEKIKPGEKTNFNAQQLKLLNQRQNCCYASFDLDHNSIASLELGNFFKINQQEKEVTWQTLTYRVVYTISSMLLQQGNFVQSLQLIKKKILSNNKENIHLLFLLVRIYLQIGDIQTAISTVETAENLIYNLYNLKNFDELLATQTIPKEYAILILNHKALIAMSNDEFQIGIELFDKLLSIDEHQVDAVSNRALCLLYSHKLMQAIETLEKFMEVTPEKHVHETIVFNLCTLYDLAWSDGITRKEELLAKVHSYLPDDFDFDVFKIPVTD